MIAAPARRLVALSLVALLALAACGGGSTAAPASPPAAGIPEGCPTSPPPPMAADDTATVTLATEKGDIVIEVKGSLAPNAAGNFVALAECGFFDGTVFHRLAPGFVIQGGGYRQAPDGDPNQGGPGYQFADDPVTTAYVRGTVAMANAGPNTNGSQFFICLADLSQSLAPSYSIFGTVIQGMDAVDTIAAMPNDGSEMSLAINPVVITKATVTRP